jgi:hypothetical protein
MHTHAAPGMTSPPPSNSSPSRRWTVGARSRAGCPAAPPLPARTCTAMPCAPSKQAQALVADQSRHGSASRRHQQLVQRGADDVAPPPPASFIGLCVLFPLARTKTQLPDLGADPRSPFAQGAVTGGRGAAKCAGGARPGRHILSAVAHPARARARADHALCWPTSAPERAGGVCGRHSSSRTAAAAGSVPLRARVVDSHGGRRSGRVPHDSGT